VCEVLGAFVALDADPASLDDVALGERIVALDALARRVSAAQAAAVRAFDLRNAADAFGCPTTAAWLRSRTGSSEREARALVGLGRSLDRLPALAAAFAEGAVSAAHLRIASAATRILPADVVAEGEPFLAATARTLDAGRFAAVVRHWVARVAPAAFERDTERRYDARWLSVTETFAGMRSIQGMLDPESGAFVESALTALVAANPSDDARTRDQQRADALTELVHVAVAQGASPASGAVRPEIVVQAATAAAAFGAGGSAAGSWPGDLRADGRGEGRGEGRGDGGGDGRGDGPHAAGSPATRTRSSVPVVPPRMGGQPLTREAFERLACDAQWRRLLVDAASVPVELGRVTRTVPPGLRKYVALRDGGCRYPGCARGPAFCEAHHAVFWRNGGRTDADNLVLLCRYHHHLVHERSHELKLLPDGTVKVTRPNGRVLTGLPRGPT
jgi:hypothetical protein